MFGGSFLNNGFDDPFFSAHQQHMQSMQQMMGGGSPFGGASPFGLMANPAIMDRGQQHRGQQQQLAVRQQQQPAYADPFGDIFGNMDGMMHSMMGSMGGMMGQMMQQPSMGAGGSPMYSQSSVMTYSNTGGGQPRIYQATSSTHQGPGGVRETRKTVRDSESGVEKMAVGRHMNDQGVVITRSNNRRTREQEENKDFINLDEEDVAGFNHEWQERTGGRSRHRNHVTDGQRSQQSPVPRKATNRLSRVKGGAKKGDARKPKKRVTIQSPHH